jgi:hypothetical protein
VVVTAPLLLVALLPVVPTETSRGLTVAMPLYSMGERRGKQARC